ncbi:7-cyano-7-deazaguanine synthase QueC [Verrucomicrobia bacterium LW23]|nr:7-cyano-7-deazaguanine synthase QueC [Verrucomicrobia bacterium LW23]
MNTVAVYSGGMDSTVLLYHLLEDGHQVRALSVNYGQKHSKELKHAASICAELGVEHRIADLRSISDLLAGSSLTSPDIQIPEGHYAEENMKTTVVPNRNMILLAIATGWAISIKAGSVSYGAHSGDHAIYPDCRDEFAAGMDHVMSLADWHSVTLNRPFVNLAKTDIAKLGAKLKVPFSRTWSCYKGNELHCGKCGTCVERREAFYLAELEDPTIYESDAPPIETCLLRPTKG